MYNINHTSIHSSWNSDRVGSCVASKTHKERRPRAPYVYAEYRGNEVSVCGSRGRKRFTIVLDSNVASAVIRDGQLVIETADACARTYDVVSGRLLVESRPEAPTGRLCHAELMSAA